MPDRIPPSSPPETPAPNPGEPIQYLPSDAGTEPDEGMALCLSGGGYRAMLFHTGTLIRLNQIGWLPKLKRISSVSGGSITSGVLAMNWSSLNFENSIANNFEEMLVAPLRSLASRTIDWQAALAGVFWFGCPGNHVANAYRRHLFGKTTLQDITSEPRFVFNATSLQSGVLWRFEKPYMADYRVGMVENPKVDLALAVAASSAFPPVLSPLVLNLSPADFKAKSGTDLDLDEYHQKIVLTDGGVYDNLGLETAWKRYKTILVSDAGGGFSPDERPWHNWILQALRVLFTIDNQVRSLRKRQVEESLQLGIRKGAYWGIEADLQTQYPIGTPLPCPCAETLRLAATPTRLKKLDPTTQEKLINWGYAMCDIALRQFMNADSTIPLPKNFPYPNSGV